MIPEFYKSYTSEDFVLDNYFRRNVKDLSGSALFLAELIEKYPGKKEEIRLAEQIVKGFHVDKIRHSNEHKLGNWNKLVKKKNRQRSMKVLSISLVFIGFLILALSIILPSKKSVFRDFTFSEGKACSKPMLLLTDYHEIIMDRPNSIIQYDSKGTEITLNGTLKMVQTHPEKGFNQMYVPYGEGMQVLLSDGTKVWLNSGSRLAFTPVFKGKKREVYLEGEAYFEVKEDKERPFYVRTEVFNVRVYGTRFDVKAIKKENIYNTVLLEGSVRFDLKHSDGKKVFLVPNQMVSLSQGLDSIMFSEVTKAENNIAWIDGYMIFDNEDISSVLDRVSEYYNIPISLQFPANSIKISGKLDLKTDIVRVLDGLALLSKTNYTHNGEGYTFNYLN